MPTVYTAVQLESALDSALKKHESELREMETRKRELEDLSRQQRFRPSDEVSTFKMLKSLKEIASVAIPTLLSAEQEFLWIAPKQRLTFSSMFGITEVVEKLTARGGQKRGITAIEYSAIPLVRELMSAGETVRHFEDYRGLYYRVFDRRYCISAINIDIKHLRLDESAVMLYTDDPVYADYLVSTFEMLWQQSVPAEERIQQLLQQGSPQA